MPSVDLNKFSTINSTAGVLLRKLGHLIDPTNPVSTELQRSGGDKDLLFVRACRYVEALDDEETLVEITLSDWRDMTPEQIDNIGRQVVYEASKKLLNV
ncbi:hypothetical protein [Schaalia sp. ZJ1691]|uniref:hypothetical protein n=1 Tax=Schaalia sp. ZJ1691 TaxID=2709404 RepID=UPI0013ED4319|nr:hypothetical protein [Schaalia sp. ZJ1691]